MRILATVLVSALTACRTAPEKAPDIPYRPASETEAAIREMKAEWFVKCEAEAPATKNAIADLLTDYVAVAKFAATCKERHNSMVDYLYPIFQKERMK